MSKRILFIIITVCFLVCFTMQVSADHLSGKDDWAVTFTTANKLESNFSIVDYADQVKGLQPGDDITFQIRLVNDNPDTANWYMANEVLSTLEQTQGSEASGGAYAYYLAYSGPGGDLELYNSETVGGDDTQGLLDATNALEDFFYLDRLSHGQEGRVILRIALDGETQDNSYQGTMADLKMNFAVETGVREPETTTSQNETTTSENETTTPENETTGSENPTTGGENPTTGGRENPTTGGNNGTNRPQNVVKTGDQSPLLIYYIIMGASGLLFLILAISSVRSRRKEKKQNAR